MEAARRVVGFRIVAERLATTKRHRVLVVWVFMDLRFLTEIYQAVQMNVLKVSEKREQLEWAAHRLW